MTAHSLQAAVAKAQGMTGESRPPDWPVQLDHRAVSLLLGLPSLLRAHQASIPRLWSCCHPAQHVPAVRVQAALLHTCCKLADHEDHPDYWAWIIAWVEPDAACARAACQEDSDDQQTDATHAPMPKPVYTRLCLRLFTEAVLCSKDGGTH